jgi:uncharacterized glyoxalase superfamily protein PhnB
MESLLSMQTTSASLVEKACGSFLIVDISVSKPSLKKTLPKPVVKKIAAIIAKAKADGEVVEMDAQVKLFGPLYKQFNDEVLKPLGQFRNNQVYTRLELDGGRAFLTSEFPTAYPELEKIAEATVSTVEQAVEKHFDQWVEAGVSSAIRTYEKVFPSVEQWVRDAIPTKQQFIENCSIQIGLPRRIDTQALAGVSLPAALLADIQAQQCAAAQAQLETARVQAIDMVKAHLAKVEEQLDGADNRRLHDSLITNLQGSAATLRGFVEAYDSDPRLLEVCDIIDEKIGSVASAEVWKASQTASDNSRQAAKQATKQLDDLRDRDISKLSASADDIVIGEGGLLADLI